MKRTVFGAILVAVSACKGNVGNGLEVPFLVTIRVSEGAGGQANGPNTAPAVSGDGRFVAFASLASNLVAGDSNGVRDIFVRDTVTGSVVCASTTSIGGLSNGASDLPSLSRDGRYVAFETTATNLHPDDPDTVPDVLVKDLVTGAVTLASEHLGTKANDSCQAATISLDGTKVGFVSTAGNLPGGTPGIDRVYVRDLAAGTVELASRGTGVAGTVSASSVYDVSEDGRWVAFATTDMLAPDDMAGFDMDIYLRDLLLDTTALVSRASGVAGAKQNIGAVMLTRVSLSGDGTRVAWTTAATNLLPVGSDQNGLDDVYLRDLTTNATARLSVSSAGLEMFGGMHILAVRLSEDGLTCLFVTDGGNLVDGDTNGLEDVFARLIDRGETLRLSVRTFGEQALDLSLEGALSADGRIGVFSSLASNLVDGDANGVRDIFRRGPIR